MNPGLKLLDRYVLTSEVGAGGMATIFAARDERTGKFVAVKVINRRVDDDDEGAALLVRWFKREQKALMLLDHPGILRLLDHGETEDGQPFSVTELLTGSTLEACIDELGPLPEEAFLGFAHRVLDALSTAHKARIVHRDIKPENIFLCEGGRVVLLDFGIARGTEHAASKTVAKSFDTNVAGTPYFLAPEQLQGVTLSARSDLFSLGGTFFFALTGRRPYEGRTAFDVYQALLQNNRPFIHKAVVGLNPGVANFVEHLLAFDPAARPADATQALILCDALFDSFQNPERALSRHLKGAKLDREHTSFFRLRDFTDRDFTDRDFTDKTEPTASAASDSAASAAQDATAIAPRSGLQTVTQPVPPKQQEAIIAAVFGQRQGRAREAATTQPSNDALRTDPVGQRPRARRTGVLAVLVLSFMAAMLAVGLRFKQRRSAPPAAPTSVNIIEVPEVLPPKPTEPTVVAPIREPALVEAPPPEARPEPRPEPRPERPRPPAAPDLSAPGTLSVRLKQWAEVTLDGKPLGRKQIAFKLPLPPGKHRLRFVNSELGTRDIEVQIGAGKDEALVVDFSR